MHFLWWHYCCWKNIWRNFKKM